MGDDIIEIEGNLKSYNTGRSEEFEFEPTDYNDSDSEEYYDNNWEDIEEDIMGKLIEINENINMESDKEKGSLWNRMIKIMNEHPDEDIRKKVDILLGQYNTAGGIKIKDELENFLLKHGY